jgi:hypothetical protein
MHGSLNYTQQDTHRSLLTPAIMMCDDAGPFVSVGDERRTDTIALEIRRYGL